MWKKTFTKVYCDISKEQIWQAWQDVSNWPKWDSQLEYCHINGGFIKGNHFILKPKGSPPVKIVLSEITPNKSFADYVQFLGAKMYDVHELTEEIEGLRITNTIYVKGLFSFIWILLVAKKVAEGIPKQTDNLVNFVKSRYE